MHELKQAQAGCRLASSPYGQARGCCVSVSDSKGTPTPLSESDAHRARLAKATFVPASINSASAKACADNPLDAAMAKRRTERASTSMAVRKQRLDAMRSANNANPFSRSTEVCLTIRTLVSRCKCHIRGVPGSDVCKSSLHTVERICPGERICRHLDPVPCAGDAARSRPASPPTSGDKQHRAICHVS
jgi:hypothetical protein